MRKLINMVGERYGKLEVIEFHHREKQGTFWKCRCDCGNIITIPRKRLVGDEWHKGKTSCGCDKPLSVAESVFGKKFKYLTESEKKEYDKLKYKNAASYKKQIEWIEMHKALEVRRKERELNKKLEPLNNVKFNIMQLDINSENLKKIEQIINTEINKIKENILK